MKAFARVILLQYLVSDCLCNVISCLLWNSPDIATHIVPSDDTDCDSCCFSEGLGSAAFSRRS